MKKVLILLGIIAFLAMIIGVFNIFSHQEPVHTSGGYLDATYTINGQAINLENGFAQTQAVSGSVPAITTKYFGGELKTDLNGDSQEDVVFILTQEIDGSEPLYYVVAALHTDSGYLGSEAYLLGSGVDPQSLNVSTVSDYENVVVIDYADSEVSQSTTTQASVARTLYLQLVADTIQWEIFETDLFEPNPGLDASPDSVSNLIQVESPQAGERVGSPIQVRGQARGYWFFEATAPVVVTNWDGLILGEGYIQAQSDWMTEEFVPFTGEIIYQQTQAPYSATGTIIFKKANPSGFIEHDAAFEMSVQLEEDSV